MAASIQPNPGTATIAAASAIHQGMVGASRLANE